MGNSGIQLTFNFTDEDAFAAVKSGIIPTHYEKVGTAILTIEKVEGIPEDFYKYVDLLPFSRKEDARSFKFLRIDNLLIKKPRDISNLINFLNLLRVKMT